MSNEKVDEVAKAIEGIPDIWGRRNKSRTDGFQWEVGYVKLGEAISENTTHIIAAFANPSDAAKRAEQERKLFRARAAIAAMREPTLEMLEAATHHSRDDLIWRAMIDECLK